MTPDGAGCRVQMLTDTLDWPIMVLARLDTDFTVESPPELASLVASTGERFGRAVPPG